MQNPIKKPTGGEKRHACESCGSYMLPAAAIPYCLLNRRQDFPTAGNRCRAYRQKPGAADLG